MTVSRRSWHYRLWKIGRLDYEPTPTNLCPYFWNVAGRLVLAFVAFILVSVGVPIGAYMLLRYHAVEILRGAAVAIAAVAAASAAAAIGIGVGMLHMRWRRRRPRGREESVVIAFLRAKKARICPRIELVD